ncbi:putative nuclease HARBI1 [Mercenaria mercenaria]|uniref:putative nuclease HARBI1 n=1 Tax=Mercenaria mercenaria TaxID=6596 RepID=UPI00234E3C84|nr:putative nuclease HARBI1 [Mercenaria mercenaria]
MYFKTMKVNANLETMLEAQNRRIKRWMPSGIPSIDSWQRAVKRTTTSICQLLPTFVKFPADFASTQREFYNIAGFPKVLGCVDGTHVKIQAQIENEPDYVNRKGIHSINVQMVYDSRFMITNVVAKWPGIVQDSRIFRESGLCRRFEEGLYHGLLLGDSGYACGQFLFTPYLRPNAQERVKAVSTLDKRDVGQCKKKMGFCSFSSEEAGICQEDRGWGTGGGSYL